MRTNLNKLVMAGSACPLSKLLTAALALALALTFGCTSDIEMPPPPPNYSSSTEDTGSSSSSSLPSTVWCMIGENCVSVATETCSAIGGQIVESCPANASSSSLPSSSSSGCMGSGSYCYYGGCSQWSSDGWSCPNGGGCYPMPTNDDCRSGTLVSVCPANAIPPVSNYCELPSSSSVPPSSSSSASGTSGTFTDSRDSKVYKWVKIGAQTWMAENLNYNTSGSKCYDNQENNCTIYGKLYDWSTAMTLLSTCNSSTCASQIGAKHKGICPDGWHIPSDAEWTTLTNFVGSDAGTKLKANSGLWISSDTFTDNYGFSALPGGGDRSDDGHFSSAGYNGDWWSAKENDANNAYEWGIYSGNEYFNGGYTSKSHLFSIRCVKD